jgi:hypothetical protein
MAACPCGGGPPFLCPSKLTSLCRSTRVVHVSKSFYRKGKTKVNNARYIRRSVYRLRRTASRLTTDQLLDALILMDRRGDEDDRLPIITVITVLTERSTPAWAAAQRWADGEGRRDGLVRAVVRSVRPCGACGAAAAKPCRITCVTRVM